MTLLGIALITAALIAAAIVLTKTEPVQADDQCTCGCDVYDGDRGEMKTWFAVTASAFLGVAAAVWFLTWWPL